MTVLNHLQSRTSDQHKGVSRHRRFSPTTLGILLVIIAVVAAVLWLS